MPPCSSKLYFCNTKASLTIPVQHELFTYLSLVRKHQRFATSLYRKLVNKRMKIKNVTSSLVFIRSNSSVMIYRSASYLSSYLSYFTLFYRISIDSKLSFAHLIVNQLIVAIRWPANIDVLRWSQNIPNQ